MMKVKDIRWRNSKMRRKFTGKLKLVPRLGVINGEEDIQVWEDRASQFALRRFFRSRAMNRFRIGRANDDALAPDIPKGAWLGADANVSAYQGKAYYLTKQLPQHRKEGTKSQVNIVRIEKNESGYIYYFDKNDPIQLKNLDEVAILGRIEAICENDGFCPKARVL